MQQAKVSSSEDLTKMLEDKSLDLVGLDPNFCIELGILSQLGGEAAKETVKQMIRDQLPNATRIVPVNIALCALQGVLAGGMFKFLPPSSQSAFRFALKLVAAVDGGTFGELKIGVVSQWWQEIYGLMPFFAV